MVKVAAFTLSVRGFFTGGAICAILDQFVAETKIPGKDGPNIFPTKPRRRPPSSGPSPENRISPRKSLGQNFLSDPVLACRIAALAQESPLFPCRIVEIGPGKGILSRSLATMTDDLWLIERDARLMDGLRASLPEESRVRIIETDALGFDFGSDLSPYIVVSNLPYNISVPLYLKLLGGDFPPVFMVLMFQREVAKRLVAKKGDPDYGHLSVVTTLLARISKKMDLQPGAFSPAPKVQSSVVTVQPARTPEEGTWAAIALSRKLFCYRRKSLARAFRIACPETGKTAGEIFPRADSAFLARKIDDLGPDDFLNLAIQSKHHLPLFFDRMHSEGKELLKT
ncbi:MAG: 16S rRNA (adenine(1518)-N(6)/adenine(1519)-N(6))-dimethyltransferase RsmA [Leptospirillum sp.]